MIQASLNHIGFLEEIIAGLDQEIDRKLKDYHKEYDLLQTIPGVKGHITQHSLRHVSKSNSL